MDAARDPIRTQFSSRYAIETPEHVVVELELAGLGSRLAAVVIDTILVSFLLTVLGFGIAGLAAVAGPRVAPWFVGIGIILSFLIIWGYYVLFEALNGGRTPGKKYVGIRTLMDTGHPITFGAAAARNLVRMVDSLPIVGLPMVLLHSQHKRLGDLVAGTIVVREQASHLKLGAPAAAAEARAPVEAGAPELGDAEYALLGRLLERLDDLETDQRARLVEDVASRLAPRFPRRPADAATFLVDLYAAELQKRQGRFATRATAGAGRTTMAAERFVARKQAAWEDFHKAASSAERTGLASMGPREIPGFAARYREVIADLARARTYAVDARVLNYLERVVTAGHNAIYGVTGRRRWRFSDLLLRELPAAVVRERAAVLLAFTLFTVPAVAGYFVIRERPEAAYELLPEAMIARAEAGVSEETGGTGYAETPDPFLPLVASSIIANNVQVAFGAFAFGVTAGLGTVVVLGFNGLFLGAVLGLFANYGLADWLLTFVAGHGVLELAAIFIAGGAGLVIGRAILAPGDLRRRDAMVVHGRTAVRMVGAATCMLILAGTIEGFLSASDAPAPVKLGVSAASAVLLALYLANGWRYSRRPRGTAPGSAHPGEVL
ncbi:MAG TPA: stage II sporulation protein M [Gemmatimonadales bacterium]